MKPDRNIIHCSNYSHCRNIHQYDYANCSIAKFVCYKNGSNSSNCPIGQTINLIQEWCQQRCSLCYQLSNNIIPIVNKKFDKENNTFHILKLFPTDFSQETWKNKVWISISIPETSKQEVRRDKIGNKKPRRRGITSDSVEVEAQLTSATRLPRPQHYIISNEYK